MQLREEDFIKGAIDASAVGVLGERFSRLVLLARTNALGLRRLRPSMLTKRKLDENAQLMAALVVDVTPALYWEDATGPLKMSLEAAVFTTALDFRGAIDA
ncbi:hypothetical protein AB4Y32_35565 [Paraburkholderia phymatum]|uniref:Uncharacterized protein n=1 Tax=Paraburkholderia phymatum TaxID=148447 RepID=A0ACC6UBL1_9BURK